MKCFVLVLPEYGHLNPVASVIEELISSNSSEKMEIIFYATRKFQPLIERTGATFREYVYVQDEEKYKQPSIGQLKYSIFTKPPAIALSWRMLDFCDHVLPQLVADVERDQPDLIIYDHMALHAKYLLRSIKLRYRWKASCYRPPKAIMFSTCFALKSGVFPSFRQLMRMMNLSFMLLIHFFFVMLNQLIFSWKHKLDVINLAKFWLEQKEQMVIVTTFSEFQPFYQNFDSTFKFAGSCISENVRMFETTDEKLREYISLFEPVNPLKSLDLKPNSDMKLVYASMGTVFNVNLFIFDHIIEAIQTFNLETDSSSVKAEQLRVIISTGDSEVYQKFMRKAKNEGWKMPENIVFQPFVPQIEILKRASLFITHAGMNSVNEAIFYGVPVICLPIAADQSLVAMQIKSLGLGKFISLTELTTPKLRKAINHILNDGSQLQKMIQISKVSRKQNGAINGSMLIMSHLKDSFII